MSNPRDESAEREAAGDSAANDKAPDPTAAGGASAESAAQSDAAGSPAEPNSSGVVDYLMYGLSLPERAVRSTSALASGILRGTTSILVPRAFRSSKTYNIFVQQMLDFMAEDIGGVERKTGPDAEASSTQIENYVARKSVGNFMELAGIAALHLSPITVLAIFADVAYGSTAYMKELCDELKRDGVIDENSTFSNASELLEAVSKVSTNAATTLDTPPLSVEGLKETIKQTTEAASRGNPAKLLPMSELDGMWREMRDIATTNGCDLIQVSGAMTMFTLRRVGAVGRGALSSVKVAGNLFERHILSHYTDAITEIHAKGLYRTLAENSKPYIGAVWKNFGRRRRTITEYLFRGRMFVDGWRGVKWLFRRRKKAGQTNLPGDAPPQPATAEASPREGEAPAESP